VATVGVAGAAAVAVALSAVNIVTASGDRAVTVIFVFGLAWFDCFLE
jgi:hypothetical protein